jgi:hypothetical protein
MSKYLANAPRPVEPTLDDEDLADFDLIGQGYSFYVAPESQPKCLWEERASL